MHPVETFQLTINFKPSSSESILQLKDDVKNWLLGNGEEAFVEGAIDDLYLDLPFEASAQEQYEQLGGDELPLFVYKYDRHHLKRLQEELERDFIGRVACEMGALLTESWMEGWKESFKPLTTERFYIYPPWIPENLPQGMIHICIEPGMAFGTGQHATTMLCLEALEKIEKFGVEKTTLVDVGTGTGILAIAAKKLGYSKVTATDIDPDSIIASGENSRVNGCNLDLQLGTIPVTDSKFSVLLANIIFYVLRRIIGDLADQVAEGGFLVLSGILSEETRDMEELSRVHGLVLIEESCKSDWACQIYRKA